MIEDQEIDSSTYHYECNKCKCIIPASYYGPENDQIVMVKEAGKVPAWVFECFDCNK